MSTNIRNVTIAFFSGTGGTKAIAGCFASQFQRHGCNVNQIQITSNCSEKCEPSDLLIVLSPVYAFRLVSLVEDWVKKLPDVQNTAAAIISVSGGGEVSPNTACRVRCGRLLKRKGYHVGCEQMLVMPSNFVVQAENHLNYRLLTVLSDKVERIVGGPIGGRKEN
jgi:flavodoxin